MHLINKDPGRLLANVDCFLLDMDGTIYLGDQLLPKAKEFLQAVEASGRKYLFLTNNSSTSTERYLDKLKRLGVDSPAETVLTSGAATADYLNNAFPGKSVYLVGTDALKAEFEGFGIRLDYENPDLLVTAFDTTLDYKKLKDACHLAKSGIPYIATHPDFNCPLKDGDFLPDIGALTAYINASVSRLPDIVIGKPELEMIKAAERRTGCAAARMAMVGDRLYTDMAMARRHGLVSLLVLSGETTKEDLAQEKDPPQIVCDGVGNIIDLL